MIHMSPEQRDAHLRMLEQLKCRTRTHVCRDSGRQKTGHKYSRQKREELKQRLLAMRAAGARVLEMRLATGTSNKTIIKLIGRVPGRKGGRPRREG